MNNIVHKAYAPIILFVYNRREHVEKVIEALLTCEEAQESELYIYSDAPKDSFEIENVEEVRNYIRLISGFKSINIVEQQKNLGIEKSEIQAITEIINKYGKAIMIEDDIVVGKQFLEYINSALEKYKHDSRVFSVTGYSFINFTKTLELPEYGFTQLTSAWGWATWADRWELLEQKISHREIELLLCSKVRRKFDKEFIYSDILYKQFLHNSLTWDILWYWTSFIHSGLTLIPSKTMVNNIGMDGSGVHYSDSNMKNRIEDLNMIEYSMNLPETIVESEELDYEIRKTLSKLINKPNKGIKKFYYTVKKILKWKWFSIKLKLWFTIF